MTNMLLNQKARILTTLAVLLFPIADAVAQDSNVSAPLGTVSWRAFGFTDDSGIPLPVTLPDSNIDVYVSALLAIKIESIECDGRRLIPSGGVAIDPIDTRIVKAEANSVIYRILTTTLGVIEVYDKKTGDYAASLYFFPKEMREIKVAYRVRFPNRNESATQYVRVSVSW